jgi:hypothetical protein
MIRKKYLALSLFVFTVLLGFTSSAFADPIVLDGVIGSTVSFAATLENPVGSGAALFLNGSDYTIDSPLTLNDLLFANFPISIHEGSSASGTLFTVDLPLGMTPGLYNGVYFILGGFTPNDLDTLAEIDFQINAQPRNSPIPEPGTWVLLATGLGVPGFVVISRRRPKFSVTQVA